jgi:DNA polymerase-3 subunit gamma/tau
MLDNKLQDQELKNEKIDLLNFLRTGLKNFDITISSIIAVSTTTKKPYTSKDKYNYFVEKNPAMEELRKVFNLTID